MHINDKHLQLQHLPGAQQSRNTFYPMEQIDHRSTHQSTQIEHPDHRLNDQAINAAFPSAIK